ncbi:hypothetical protein ACLOJK_034593 [Asimina triloba]
MTRQGVPIYLECMEKYAWQQERRQHLGFFLTTGEHSGARQQQRASSAVTSMSPSPLTGDDRPAMTGSKASRFDRSIQHDRNTNLKIQQEHRPRFPRQR